MPRGQRRTGESSGALRPRKLALHSGENPTIPLASNGILRKSCVVNRGPRLMKQSDLFLDDEQQELFDEASYSPPVYHPDPERVRTRLHGILAEARSASTLPWDSRRLGLYRTIFPQMTLSLPEDEAAQLRFEFEEELVRLKAA